MKMGSFRVYTMLSLEGRCCDVGDGVGVVITCWLQRGDLHAVTHVRDSIVLRQTIGRSIPCEDLARKDDITDIH